MSGPMMVDARSVTQIRGGRGPRLGSSGGMPIHVKNERFRRVWKPFRPLSGQMASRGWIWAWEGGPPSATLNNPHPVRNGEVHAERDVGGVRRDPSTSFYIFPETSRAVQSLEEPPRAFQSLPNLSRANQNHPEPSKEGQQKTGGRGQTRKGQTSQMFGPPEL